MAWVSQKPETVVRAIGQVVNDTTPPATTIRCNGAACSSSPYPSPVTVTLIAADAESTVASTHYTTDGNEPTTSSPIYVGSFWVSSSATVKFRSWDVRGNVEAINSKAITIDTPPITTIDSEPSSLSDEATPVFTFSANESSTFKCALDGGAETTCSSPYTTPALSQGSHTLMVTATDLAGSSEVGPPSYTWTVDTIPPVTTIEAKPPADAKVTDASFSFKASEPATFECRLDGDAFKACSSPDVVSGLADGSHTFKVRATDTAGNVETSPPSDTWTVDTTPPITTIDSEPLGETIGTGATISFSADEPVAFECSLDGGAYASCTSPYVAFGLSTGVHALKVKATDAAGNVELEPAVYSWVVIAAGGLSTSPGTVGGGPGSGSGSGEGSTPTPTPPRVVLAKRAGGEVLRNGLPVALYCPGACSTTIVVSAPVVTKSGRKRSIYERLLASVHSSALRAGVLKLRVKLTRKRGASIRGGPLRTVPLAVVATVHIVGGGSFELHGVVSLRAHLGSLRWV